MTIKSKAFKFLLGIAVVLAVAVTASLANAADFGTATLRVGSRGAAVMEVQKLVGVTPDGAYGPLTKAAVEAWQANNGLVPVDGIFGAMSRAKAYELAGSTGVVAPSSGCQAGWIVNPFTNQPCGTTTPTTPSTPSVLEGEEAELDWDLEEEDITADAKDQHAFTIEVEADRDGGDAKIERLDLTLVASDDKGEISSYRAITRVALKVDGDVIAEEDTDSRSAWRSDKETIRFSGLDLIVKSGKVVEIEVILDVTDRIEGGDVTLENVAYRYTDATGYIESESNAGISGVATVEAADALSFRITENRSNPSDTTLDVSSSRNGETLAIVDVETRKGEGTIEDVEVKLTLTGVDNDLSDLKDLLSRVSLEIDGKRVDYISSSSLVAGDLAGDVLTLSFDADEFDVEEDDKFEIEVIGDLRAYDLGDGDITDIQVTNIKIYYFDIGEDTDSNYGKSLDSIAPLFALTEGDVLVAISDVEVRKTDDHKGTIVFDLEVENDTGAALKLADKYAVTTTKVLTELTDWTFDVKGYGATVASVKLDTGTLYKDTAGTAAVDDNPAFLADGDIATFEVTLDYTSTSTKAFTIEVEEIGGVALGYVWAD